MRPRTEICAAAAGAIRRAMRAACRPSTFQRLQCLWLRARQDFSTEAIAQTVGLSVSHVRRVWSDYLRGGLAVGQGRPKGGRRHQNLTVDQEQALLQPLRQQAQAGQLITARSLKARSEIDVGHAARLDGLPAAGASPVAARVAPAQTPPRPSGGAGCFLKNSRPKWTPWRLGTRTGPCA